MKAAMRLAFSLFGLFAVSAQRLEGAKALDGKFEVYPWSEESEFVRIDKKILKEFVIRSLDVRRFETMEFALTEAFARTFKLTKAQVQVLEKETADAQHEYRTVEAKHFSA